MMLAKNLYKLSGIEYGTCSNTYALDWGEGIACSTQAPTTYSTIPCARSCAAGGWRISL